MAVTMDTGRWCGERGMNPGTASFANMSPVGSSINVCFARSRPAGLATRICRRNTDGRGRRSGARRDGLIAWADRGC